MAMPPAGGRIEVQFWGTRGSIPTPGASTARYGGNTSCVEVRVGDRLLILDAGTGLRLLGLDLLTRFEGRPIQAHFLISHTHWDHIQGLPFFAPFYGKGHRFEIRGPTGIDRTLEKLIRGQMDPHYFPVDMTDLEATVTFHEFLEPVIVLGDVTVRTQYLHHTTLALGYRIEHRGRSVVYATDHELYRRMYTARGNSEEMLKMAERHDAEFAAFIAGADLYVAEAQYSQAEYPGKIGWGHSTVEDIAALAADAGVGRLVIFHHDPVRTDDAIDGFVGTAQKVIADRKSRVDCIAASEGTTLTV